MIISVFTHCYFLISPVPGAGNAAAPGGCSAVAGVAVSQRCVPLQVSPVRPWAPAVAPFGVLSAPAQNSAPAGPSHPADAPTAEHWPLQREKIVCYSQKKDMLNIQKTFNNASTLAGASVSLTLIYFKQNWRMNWCDGLILNKIRPNRSLKQLLNKIANPVFIEVEIQM